MIEPKLAATAGEHYVAHKIAMLGFVPMLVQQPASGIDLLVSMPNCPHTVGVQVRTARNAMHEPEAGGTVFDLRFPLGHRAVTSSDPNLVFCFVDLRQDNHAAHPDVYVVPAAILKKEYERVYLRRYSDVVYARNWRSMQPYRNNWTPLIAALTAVASPVLS